MNDQRPEETTPNATPQDQPNAEIADFSERTIQPASPTVQAESLDRADAQASIASEVEQPTSAMPTSSGVTTPIGGGMQPVASTPKKKPLIVAIIAGVLALVLLGGGVYAYTVYQKPENVLLHAASNALSTKKVRTKTVVTSDYSYTAEDMKISFEKLTFETGGDRSPRYDTNAEIVAKYNDKQVALRGSVLATEAGELYFKLENVKDTLQKVLPADMKMSAKAEEYLSAIDGKWARYTLEDLKKDSPDYGKTVQCTLDVYKKYKDDKKSIQEVVDIYKANQFVVVKGDPASKDGNFGYVVDVDKKKSKAFGKAVEKTTMAKELTACDKNASTATEDSDNTEDTAVDTPSSTSGPVTTTTVWISKWNHELRAVDTKTIGIKGQNNKEYTVTSHTDVDFRTGATTAVPSNTMPLKTWSENAQNFYKELLQSPTTTASTTAANNASKIAAGAESYAANNRGTYPANFAAMSRYVTLDAGITVVTELPKSTSEVSYKLCGARNGQVVYKTSSGYKALGVGSGKSGTITQLCA